MAGDYLSPSGGLVEHLRRAFPPGTRIVLLEMEDPQAPPPGTHGTVLGVDDAGHILVGWDSGSGLNVILGVDRIEIEPP